MTFDMLFVLCVLGGAAILFATNRVRSDIVAIMVCLALMLSGVLSPREALAGFADPVVILIATLFIVSEALVNTGLAQGLGDAVLRAGGNSETRLVALLMLAAGGVGAFMSSTAVVAIFIPVTLMIAQRTGLNPKRLMMPLSVAALISGMMTLIATAPNLVVDEALKERGLPSLGFFGFSPFGIATLVVAILFMLAVGRSLLAKTRRGHGDDLAPSVLDLVGSYGLQERFHRLRVLPQSPLHDHTIARMRLRDRFGVIIIGLDKGRRGRHDFRPARTGSVFAAGDAIFVIGADAQIAELIRTQRLEALPPLSTQSRRQALQEIGMAEVLLVPGSQLVGQTLREAAFRSRYGLSVLAVRHRGAPVAADHVDIRLDYGDALLVAGTWNDILKLRAQRTDFVLLDLPLEHKEAVPGRRRAPLALVVLAAMVAAMATGIVPNVAAVLLAALALVATGCVPLAGIYNKVGWSAVILVAGILPLATALAKTGATDIAAASLVQTLGTLGPLSMLAAVFAVTVLAGLFISNTATAVLVAPVAVDAALAIGASPHAFAMTVAVACSAAFATPVSSPVNTLVLEPGGYSFIDFVKVGLPLQLLAMLVTVGLCAVVYPL